MLRGSFLALEGEGRVRVLSGLLEFIWRYCYNSSSREVWWIENTIPVGIP
jgi:hypothetical protein